MAQTQHLGRAVRVRASPSASGGAGPLSMKTAVALFLYQRPRQLKAVFGAIAAARPARLFVVADGPRTESDRAQCEAARDIVANIDWPCEVQRLYADHNLGIRQRLGTGLDWLFSHVDE